MERILREIERIHAEVFRFRAKLEGKGVYHDRKTNQLMVAFARASRTIATTRRAEHQHVGVSDEQTPATTFSAEQQSLLPAAIVYCQTLYPSFIEGLQRTQQDGGAAHRQYQRMIIDEYQQYLNSKVA